MIYICRERNSKDNIITKSGRSLDFFYCTFLGRLLLKIVISKPISDLGGLYMNSRFSKIKINRLLIRMILIHLNMMIRNTNLIMIFLQEKLLVVKDQL